ncbi:MAG: hypothetical protein K2N06_02890 [Oscillospiraceae bacterium]|nr:hypothetical protein [Oscillospiraceae bacterium]
MRILVIGGDSRMKYAAGELCAEEYNAHTVGTFDIIVLPMPLTRDGETIFVPLSGASLPFDIIGRFAEEGAVIFAGGECERLTEICTEHRLTIVNYMKNEPLTLRNAALTAEAAVCLLSNSTEHSLLGSRILIMGYGRIASMTAERLRAFGAEITVAARRSEQRIQAELDGFRAVEIAEIHEIISGFDYTVNTVPAALFDTECFAKMHGVFLELATLPNNPPDNPEIKYIHGGGLPGKYFPETAGKFIANTIDEIYRASLRAQ